MAPAARKGAPWASAAIAALTFGLVTRGLGSQSLWPDEAYSWELALKPIGSIISQVSLDHIPPYFILLHWWIGLAGASAYAMRFMSSCFAVLAVAALVSLARSTLGRRTALLAGGLAAINPFLLYYGQEMRMYSMLLLAGALALRLLVQLSRTPGRRRLWIAYAATVTAGLYTHYYMVLLVVVLAAGPLILGAWRRLWKANLAAIAAGFVPFLPWAAFRSGVFSGFIPVTAGSLTLPRLLTDYVLAINLGEVSFELRRSQAEQPLAWAVVALGLTLAAWGLWRGPGRFQRRLLLAATVLAPLALVIALTLDRRDFTPRHLFLTMLGYLPLLAAGLMRLPRPAGILAGAALAASFLSSDQQYFGNPAYQRQDFRGAVQFAVAHAVPSDALILLSAGPLEPVWRYYAPATFGPQSLPLPLPASAEGLDQALRSTIGPADRAEVLLWQDFDDDPQHRVKPWLDANEHGVGGWGSGEVAVYGYFTGDPFPASPPEDIVPMRATFSERMELLGYKEWSGFDGRGLRLQLVWQRLAPLDRDYRVFVHLVDGQGGNLAIADHRPAFDTLNLSQWSGSPYVVDEYDLDGDPARAERLEIGLYDPASGARLAPASLTLPLPPR